MGTKFITIGDTRIRKSNIKEFGISALKKNVNAGLAGWVFSGIKSKVEGASFIDGVKESMKPSIKKYLYVTTYQGDNYKFHSDEIDIYETLEKLEKMG